VNPQTRCSSSIAFLQKSGYVGRTGRLLNRGEIYSWNRRIACALELGPGRRGVGKLQNPHSPGALGGRSNGGIEGTAFADARTAIRGVTKGTLARVAVAYFPITGVGDATRTERGIPRGRIRGNWVECYALERRRSLFGRAQIPSFES